MTKASAPFLHALRREELGAGKDDKVIVGLLGRLLAASDQRLSILEYGHGSTAA